MRKAIILAAGMSVFALSALAQGGGPPPMGPMGPGRMGMPDGSRRPSWFR